MANGYKRSESQSVCRIEYDFQGDLITKTHYPFNELEHCLNFNCSQGEYKCKLVGYCVKLDYICDGITHCLHGDDENQCGKKKIISLSN